MGSGRGWLAGEWPLTGGDVLNITAVAWTAGFHFWRSGNITRMQNVSEYMRVLALCLVIIRFLGPLRIHMPNRNLVGPTVLQDTSTSGQTD